MYCGETDYKEGVLKGDTFKVVEVGGLGFRMYREETDRYNVATLTGNRQTGNVKNYKVVEFSDCVCDETELKSEDYEMLLDYALDIKDLDWARELHAAGQEFAV